MKNFTFLSRTVLAGLLVALLSFSAQAQTHFGTLSGDIFEPQWTLYLTDINLDDVDPADGDELGIYDGSTLVGVIEFDGTETFGDNSDNPVVAWSSLTTGTGYTAGNEVTFVYWDETAQTEYTGIFTADDVYDYTPAGGGPNMYSETGSSAPTFPTGDEQFSYINLDFNIGGSVSGNVALGANDCNGDPTSIRVEALSGGNVQGYDYADENGNYEINGLPLPANNGDDITFSVDVILADHDSDGPKPATLSQGSPDATLNFNLTPHQESIELTLTEVGTANDVTGATAELFDVDDNSLGTLTDDGSGVYSIDNICVGDDYYIEVTHADYSDDNTDAFDVVDGNTATVNLELEALPGSFTGLVDDGTNPVEGAYVKVYNQDTPPVELFSTTTNANGEYTIEDISVGDYDLEAGGTIGGTSYTEVTASNEQINANTATTVDFTITIINGSLEGVVRSSTNSELIEGVDVEIFENPGGPSTGQTTSTGVNGDYSFTDVIEPGIYDIEFSKSGYLTRTMEYVVINSDETATVNAYLEEQPGALDITVEDASSVAITGASVKIGSTYTATDNNDDGTYNFTNLPLGTYDVTVTHGEYRTNIAEGIQVTFNSGNPITQTVTLEDYNWSITGANTLEDVWTIYLQSVTLDGEPVDINDEVGIFDENGTELVGVYHVESELVSWNATNQDLSAYSSITSAGSDGYSVGNEYSFKLYDASTGAIVSYPTVSLSDPNSTGAHLGNVFPSGQSPFSFATLEFRAEETQTISLETGFQMISTNLEMPDMDMAYMMNNNLGFGTNRLDYVKNIEGKKYVDLGAGWTNNIGNWNVTEGYLVKMSNTDVLELTGTPVNPQTEIELVQGYNLVSYLPETAMDAATAFASIQSELEFVRNSEGKHYWDNPGSWVNNIGDAKPGEGYFIKTSAATTLVYPSAKSTNTASGDDKPEHFNFEGGDATYPVYTIYIESDKLEAGDEVAAFDGEKMVGATKIENPRDITSNDLNLFSVISSGEGYTAGNQITFKVWSPRTNEEYTNIDVEYLNPNGDAHIESTFPEGEGHYSMIKATVTELDVPELEEAVVNVYPNPATNNLFIQTENDMTQIRVLNATGQVIMTKQVNAKEFTLNVNGMDAGIYILQTTFENRQSSLRFAVQ